MEYYKIYLSFILKDLEKAWGQFKYALTSNRKTEVLQEINRRSLSTFKL